MDDAEDDGSKANKKGKEPLRDDKDTPFEGKHRADVFSWSKSALPPADIVVGYAKTHILEAMSGGGFKLGIGKTMVFTKDAKNMLKDQGGGGYGMKTLPPHMIDTTRPPSGLLDQDSTENLGQLFGAGSAPSSSTILAAAKEPNDVIFIFKFDAGAGVSSVVSVWEGSNIVPADTFYSFHITKNPRRADLSAQSVQFYHDILSLWNTDERCPPALQSRWTSTALNEFVRENQYENNSVLREISSRLLGPHTADRSLQGLRKPNAALFWGPAGSGKTVVARSIKNDLGLRPIWFGTAPELSSKWIGDTEKQINKIFGACLQTPNVLCCVVIDEIDTLTRKRNLTQPDHKTDWLSLMLRIVGSTDYPNLLLIGTTNRKHVIDEAFLRAGRMEEHFFFGAMGREPRRTLLGRLLSHCKPPVDVDPDTMDILLDHTINFTGSSVKSIAQEVNLAMLDGSWDPSNPKTSLMAAVYRLLRKTDDQDELFCDEDALRMIQGQVFDSLSGPLYFMQPTVNREDGRTEPLAVTGVRFLADSRQDSIHVETSTGVLLHRFEIGRGERGLLAALKTLALRAGYSHVLHIRPSSFKSWDEVGVNEVFARVTEASKLYASANQAVLIVVHLDDIVGIADQVSTASTHSVSRNATRVVQTRGGQTSRSVGMTVMRPAVMHRSVLLSRYVADISKLRKGADGRPDGSAAVSLCVLTQIRELATVFRDRCLFGPSVSSVPWELSLEELPVGLKVVNGRTVRAITSAYQCVLGTKGFERGRYYWTVRADRVFTGGLAECTIGVAQPYWTGVPLNRLYNWHGAATQPVVGVGGGGTIITYNGADTPNFCRNIEDGTEYGFLLDLDNHGMLAVYRNGEFVGFAAFGINVDRGGPVYPAAVFHNVGWQLTVTPQVSAPSYFPSQPTFPTRSCWDTSINGGVALGPTVTQARVNVNAPFFATEPLRPISKDEMFDRLKPACLAFEVDLVKGANRGETVGMVSKDRYLDPIPVRTTQVGFGAFTNWVGLYISNGNIYQRAAATALTGTADFVAYNRLATSTHFTVGIAADFANKVMYLWYRKGKRGSSDHLAPHVIGDTSGVPLHDDIWAGGVLYPAVSLFNQNTSATLHMLTADELDEGLRSRFFPATPHGCVRCTPVFQHTGTPVLSQGHASNVLTSRVELAIEDHEQLLSLKVEQGNVRYAPGNFAEAAVGFVPADEEVTPWELVSSGDGGHYGGWPVGEGWPSIGKCAVGLMNWHPKCGPHHKNAVIATEKDILDIRVNRSEGWVMFSKRGAEVKWNYVASLPSPDAVLYVSLWSQGRLRFI